MGLVVGIDLGTTNTVVAAVQDGQAAALPDEDGLKLIPSVVSFHPSGNVLVGGAAKTRRLVDSANTIYSIKRLIGRSWESEEVRKARSRFPFEMREGPGQAALVVARSETYTLPEISAFVLRKAKAVAEAALGEPVDRAVITVPANFNDLQRAATKVAGRVAGLEILRILNEPTAAALAYGYGKGSTERVAIYDFGGGTFDITLLDLSGNVFEVLATAGNTFLGGDDVDLAIAERMADQFLAQHRYDARTDPQAFERLRAAAEGVKMALSTETQATVDVKDLAHGSAGKALTLSFTMTRAELETLIAPLVEDTFTVVKEALGVARLQAADFDQVLLVGGSTRIPLVRQRTEQFFGRKAVEHISPDEVVAIGAAIQANALTGAERRRGSIPAPPLPAARKTQTLTRGQTSPRLKTQPPALPQRGRVATNPGVQRPRMTTSPGLADGRARATTSPGLAGQAPGFEIAEPGRPKIPTSPGLKPPHAGEVGGAPTVRGSHPPIAVPPPEGMPSHPVPATADGPGATRRRQTTGMGLGAAAADVTPKTQAGLGARGRMPTGSGLGPAAAAVTAAPPAHTLLSASSDAATAFAASERPSSVDRGWGDASLPIVPLDDGAIEEESTLAAATRPESTVGEDVTAQASAPGIDPSASEDEIRARYGNLPLVMPGDKGSAPAKPRMKTLLMGQGASDISQEEPTAAGNVATSLASLAEDEVTAVHGDALESGDLDGLPVPDLPTSDYEPPPPPPQPARPPLAATVASGAAAGFGALGGLAAGSFQPSPTAPGALGAQTLNLGTPAGHAAPLIREMGGSPHPATFAAPARSAPGAPLLVDVTPHSLSVETVSGYCDAVINRNTPVPCEQTRQFVTAIDNQTSVRVRVSQGESSRFGENTLLGELELYNLRSAPRGQVEIAVTFALDSDGILSVQAVDAQTGQSQQARVRLVGLPDQGDVNAMAARHAAHPVV